MRRTTQQVQTLVTWGAACHKILYEPCDDLPFLMWDRLAVDMGTGSLVRFGWDFFHMSSATDFLV